MKYIKIKGVEYNLTAIKKLSKTEFNKVFGKGRTKDQLEELWKSLK